MYKQIKHMSHGIHFTFAEKGLGILLSRECYFQNCKAMSVVHCLKRGSVLEKREKKLQPLLAGHSWQFSKWSHFLSCFFYRTTVMLVNNVLSMFFRMFNFGPNVTILQRLQSFLGGHFWPFSKCSHFSNMCCSSRFLHTTTAICYRNVFSMFFFSFLIFDPKLRVCKVHSLWFVAIFGHFQNTLFFFEYRLFFPAVFCIEQQQ